MRNDVLDMVREVAVFLTEQAVFAPVVRRLADQVPRGGIHHTGFDSKWRSGERINPLLDIRGDAQLPPKDPKTTCAGTTTIVDSILS